MNTKILLIAAAALLAAGAAQAQVQSFVLVPSADTSIYADISGVDRSWDDISDGQGESLWLGTTAGGLVRRTLVRFDLSSLPANSQIVSASLTLYQSRARSDYDVTLHRLLAGWGEGGSNGGVQGTGSAATAGDATWRWRDFQAAEWAQRGGDFVRTASATQFVGPPNESYTWSSAGMATDVQGWLADPAGNFGWILMGGEIDSPTAKRFDSVQGQLPSLRPQLVLQVSPVPELPMWALLAGGGALLAGLRRSRREVGAQGAAARAT